MDSLLKACRKAGRNPSLGLRTHLVVRDTESEARAAADELIAHADPAVKAQRRSAIEGTPMVGQQAQARQADGHWVAPHLWNGLSEVRGQLRNGRGRHSRAGGRRTAGLLEAGLR